MTAKLLTKEQENYLFSLLPESNNRYLAAVLNSIFGLNLTAKQINSYKKSHKKNKSVIPVFRITKKIKGWRRV
ncbi:hypothetical protein SDC9_37451 [bioreactor metagenome]|uniref:Uncharacterized protein n=1 Tax=bioreactor metagenome TaxID=1076179 RepID=A0A644VLC6_9ZZZZ|nr:hypothetical protein [Acidaminococcaceae bacterium]